MPRRQIFPTDPFPFHVTARSEDREWFDLPMIEVWDLFSRYLYLATLSFGLRIHAFVLMSNHFHLLVSAPNDNLNEAMTYLLKEVSGAMNQEFPQSRSIFNGPHHATVIKNRLYYEHAYKYVYRNPVEARICSKVEAYPYSTLRGLIGMDPLPFPAFDNLHLITNLGAKLSWLNSPFPEIGFLEEIRKAMQKEEFEFEADSNSSGSCGRTRQQRPPTCSDHESVFPSRPE